MVTETLSCYHCGGVSLRRDGKAPNGKQRYFCRGCKKSSRQNPPGRAYSGGFQAQVLAAYHATMSATPSAGCAASSVSPAKHWPVVSKKAAKLPPLKKTIAEAQKGEPLEIDGMQH